MTLAPPRQPIDPTFGELPIAQLRPLVRAVADTVGKRVARKVQESANAGSRMTADAEKVASVTEIHRELAGLNEARVRGGMAPLSDDTHQAVLDAVMAHVYGLGELDALWG